MNTITFELGISFSSQDIYTIYEDTLSKNVYVCNTHSGIIEELLQELISMDMISEVKNKLKNYKKHIIQLLKIYDNGNGKNNFEKDNLKLYFSMQEQFSNIINLRYDIYENKILIENKNRIVNILDTIIENHRNIIEDINEILV